MNSSYIINPYTTNYSALTTNDQNCQFYSILFVYIVSRRENSESYAKIGNTAYYNDTWYAIGAEREATRAHAKPSQRCKTKRHFREIL